MTKTTIVLEYLKTQSEPLQQYDIYNNLLSYCEDYISFHSLERILKNLVSNDQVTLTHKHDLPHTTILKYYKYEGDKKELDWAEFIKLYNYVINVYEFNKQETFDEMRRLIITANPTNYNMLNNLIDNVVDFYISGARQGVLSKDLPYGDLIREIVYCQQTISRIQRNIDALEQEVDYTGALKENSKAIEPWLDFKADTLEQMVTARHKIYKSLVSSYAGNPEIKFN